MTPGGGRGWFHRKRSQPADPPTPDVSSAPKPPADVSANAEAKNSSGTPVNDQRAEPSTQPNAPLEPAVTLARSAAPPQQPGDPFQHRVEPVLAAGEVPQQPPPGPADNEIRTSAGIDWDAETAAALSGDGEAMHHPSGPTALDAHAAPDQLLEDLIREIVGDAAVDTASSLHTPRPMVGAEEPLLRLQRLPSHPTAIPAPKRRALNCRAPMSRSLTCRTATCRTPVSRALIRRGPSSEVRNPDLPTTGPSDPGVPNPDVAGPGALGREMPRQEAPTTPVLRTSVDENPPSTPAFDFNAPVTPHEQLDSPASPRQTSQDAHSPSASPPPLTVAAPTPMPSIAQNQPIGAPQVDPAAAEANATAGITAESAPATDVSRETSFDHGGTPLAHELADETRRRIALEETVLPLPPATRVLTISNQKGGVGKTTTAVNLAAALARSGARVLVIDLDPQGNASTALGVDHRSDQKSVYEVLVADLALDEVVKASTEHERLDCVPATIHLAGAEIELVSLVAREQRLRRALDAHLAAMDHPYDYVFIDCPPSLGLLTINAFVAAREVLIPIQCEYYALEGLSQLLSNIELIEKHLNPDLRLSTILLTMYDSRTNLAQQVAQEVRDHFPAQTLSTIIPRSVRVSEAPSYGQSVISYDYASSGSLSYREAAAEIARRGAAEHQESN